MSIQSVILTKNSTSNIIEILVLNGGTGKPVTGITSANVLVREWEQGKAGASVTAVPIVGSTAVDEWEAGKWQEVDSVNLKGVYQYSITDTVLQINNTNVFFNFEFAGVNDESVLYEIKITAVPLYTGVQVANNGWDALAIESFTAKEAFKLMASVLCGETTGAETNKTIFKALGNNAIDRLESSSDDTDNRILVDTNV